MRERLISSHFCGGTCGVFINVFDTQTQVHLALIGNGGFGGGGMAIDPNTGHIYMAVEVPRHVRVFHYDGVGGYFFSQNIFGMGDKPLAVALDHVHDRLYTGIHHGNQLAVIDTATETFLTSVGVLAGNPVGVAVDTSTRYVYVGQNLGNRISVVDGATNTHIANVTVGDGPVITAVDSTTHRVYVGVRNFQRVTIVDGTAGAGFPVLSHTSLGGPLGALAANQTTHCAYVGVGGLQIIKEICDGDATPPVLSLPADITVNADACTGAFVSYVVTATDDTDPSPSVSCVPASGSELPIGSTTVECEATDATGNIAVGRFDVDVLDAEAQLAVLIDLVDGLGLTPNGFANSLLTKLEHALDAAEDGDAATASNILGAFIHQVEAQAGKKLSETEAGLLVQEALQIDSLLGC